MAALTQVQWVLIFALAALYLTTCVRVAVMMRRAGRSPWLWFAATFFLTAIPVTVYIFYLRFRSLSPDRRENDV
ncbi:MAG: hypothetical protein KGY99_03905 [Phycisphaerae bacterium]|nr:hypothetical protein [Phycisphaerae bacterium]